MIDFIMQWLSAFVVCYGILNKQTQDQGLRPNPIQQYQKKHVLV